MANFNYDYCQRALKSWVLRWTKYCLLAMLWENLRSSQVPNSSRTGKYNSCLSFFSAYSLYPGSFLVLSILIATRHYPWKPFFPVHASYLYLWETFFNFIGCRKYDLFSAWLGEVTGLSRGLPRESGHSSRVSRFSRDDLEGRLKAVESVVFNCPSFSS